MTRKLEETLDLPRLDEALRLHQEHQKKFEENIDNDPNTADEIRRVLENTLSLDKELLTPQQLAQHDRDLDDIADKSMETFIDLRDLGFNVEVKHSGPIFESMVNILRLSMDARNTKIEKKLRMMKMQLDRKRLEIQEKTTESSENFLDAKDDEVFADRNKILDLLPKDRDTK